MRHEATWALRRTGNELEECKDISILRVPLVCEVEPAALAVFFDTHCCQCSMKSVSCLLQLGVPQVQRRTRFATGHATTYRDIEDEEEEEEEEEGEGEDEGVGEDGAAADVPGGAEAIAGMAERGEAELSEDMKKMLDAWDRTTQDIRKRKARWGMSNDELLKRLKEEVRCVLCTSRNATMAANCSVEIGEVSAEIEEAGDVEQAALTEPVQIGTR